jgi:hypothetical protein
MDDYGKCILATGSGFETRPRWRMVLVLFRFRRISRWRRSFSRRSPWRFLSHLLLPPSLRAPHLDTPRYPLVATTSQWCILVFIRSSPFSSLSCCRPPLTPPLTLPTVQAGSDNNHDGKTFSNDHEFASEQVGHRRFLLFFCQSLTISFLSNRARREERRSRRKCTSLASTTAWCRTLVMTTSEQVLCRCTVRACRL